MTLCYRTWFVLLVLICLGLGCNGMPSPPNLVLVTIDTLRADRVVPSARSQEIAPFLVSLAADGVSFQRAYSTSSWTAPAVVSLLTGTYPVRHGVERGAFLAGGILGQEVIPKDLQLLPETLQEHAYRTFGITANGHLAPEFGFSRGFDRYRCIGFSDAPALMTVLSEWAAEIRSARPYFLWLHLLDPHASYTSRDPWFVQRLGDSAQRPELEKVAPASRYATLGVTAGSDALAYVETLYDSEVSFADHMVREAFALLEVGPQDLVVVTSDHGEEFLEHSGFGHGATLYEESLRVPLILRYPAARHAGLQVATPVSLVDLLPVLLETLRIEIPVQSQGVALQMGSVPERPSPVYATLMRGKQITAVIDGEWKLIQQHKPEPATELFRLDQDPQEQGEVSSAHRQRIEALVRSHQEHRDGSLEARTSPIQTHSLDAERLEALRALGYLD
jgi:arylsulfatase A-like enzyme